jgi:hypothetical protein
LQNDPRYSARRGVEAKSLHFLTPTRILDCLMAAGVDGSSANVSVAHVVIQPIEQRGCLRAVGIEG